MYPTLESYAVAVAEYITSEFTDWAPWFAQEEELARTVLLAQKQKFLEYCYSNKYLPSIPGECLVTGSSVVREIASYTGSPCFAEASHV